MSDKASELPLFQRQEYHDWRTIDTGRPYVVRVSDGHIAKIAYFPGDRPVDDSDARSYVGYRRRESELLQKAYNLGIRVPRTEGMFNLSFDEDWKLKERKPRMIAPGIVMQYIQGILLTDLGHKLRRDELFGRIKGRRELGLAYESFREEVKKAKEAGFKVEDANEHNVIWNAKEQQAYLIDLELWNHPEVSNDY